MRGVLTVVLVAGFATAASAEPLTFHLAARDALASVERYNAFVVSLGNKRAHGLKVIPGGTSFAGQSCAGFGSVFRLGSISVLSGTAVLPARAPSRKDKNAIALTTVFTAAGVQSWTPPATATETSLPFWGAVPFGAGVQFASDAVTSGGDAGLLGNDVGDGVVRFQADVAGPPNAEGRYRFLLELYGRTSSNDAALVAAGERRCFTFVDLAPVDLIVLRRHVDAIVTNPTLLASLDTRLDAIQTALDRRDVASALDILAVFMQAILLKADRNGTSTVPPPISLLDARRLIAEAFQVRRGILFSPATAVCGNGIRETGEACDGADLGGLTDCTSPPLNYTSGPLHCGPDCRLDTSQCVASSVCGNGILEPGEECDNGSANSDTAPDACRTNCVRAFCGDGVIDSFEDCEGKNLNGETCISLGYSSGTLRCDAAACEFDDEHCND